MSNVPMTRPDLVLATHNTTFFHSSTFAVLDDGRILHAAHQRFTTSDDGGITWSPEFQCRDTNGDLVSGPNTSMVRLSGKGVGIVATTNEPEHPLLRLANRAPYLVFWRSEDGGNTWEPPVRISEPGAGAYPYQDVLLRTSSGRLIMPVYYSYGQGQAAGEPNPWTDGKLMLNQWVFTNAHFTDPHICTSGVYYSDDDGRTWQRNKDGELIILLESGIWSYCGEPSVTEVYPGCLLMMMRTGLGRLFQAWSYDNGETWTRPMPTSLASSTCPAQIRTLPNGHLLCLWNQDGEEDIRKGYNRLRLSTAISRNGGSVWEFFQNVESIHEFTRVEPGPIHYVRPEQVNYEPGMPAPERDARFIEDAEFHGRWAYPSVLVMKDRVLITHTYSYYEADAAFAQLNFIRYSASDPSDLGRYNQKLKVLPLEWFYGGKKPADSPFLKRAYEPAVP